MLDVKALKQGLLLVYSNALKDRCQELKGIGISDLGVIDERRKP